MARPSTIIIVIKILMIIPILLIEISSSLECYQCQSIGPDACYKGSTGKLAKTNCSVPSDCIFYQFEVNSDADGKYTKTFRGCQSALVDPCEKLMQEFKSKDGKTVEKGKTCEICPGNLCNAASVNANFQNATRISILLVAVFSIICIF